MKCKYNTKNLNINIKFLNLIINTIIFFFKKNL